MVVIDQILIEMYILYTGSILGRVGGCILVVYWLIIVCGGVYREQCLGWFCDNGRY